MEVASKPSGWSSSDEKSGASCREEGDGIISTGEEEERSAKK